MQFSSHLLFIHGLRGYIVSLTVNPSGRTNVIILFLGTGQRSILMYVIEAGEIVNIAFHLHRDCQHGDFLIPLSRQNGKVVSFNVLSNFLTALP